MLSVSEKNIRQLESSQSAEIYPQFGNDPLRKVTYQI